MSIHTRKLSTDLRTKLNTALADHRSTAVTFHGKLEERDLNGNVINQGGVTREYVKEELAKRDLPGKLAALKEEAVGNVTAAQAAYDDAYRKAATITTATDPARALLDENRAEKIWQRIERQLANPKVNASEYIREQLEHGDALTRATILTEAPSYFKGAGSEHDITTYAHILIPELGEAHKEKTNAEAYRNIVNANIRKIETATEQNLTNPPTSVDQIRYLDPDITIYG